MQRAPADSSPTPLHDLTDPALIVESPDGRAYQAQTHGCACLQSTYIGRLIPLGPSDAEVFDVDFWYYGFYRIGAPRLPGDPPWSLGEPDSRPYPERLESALEAQRRFTVGMDAPPGDISRQIDRLRRWWTRPPVTWGGVHALLSAAVNDLLADHAEVSAIVLDRAAQRGRYSPGDNLQGTPGEAWWPGEVIMRDGERRRGVLTWPNSD